MWRVTILSVAGTMFLAPMAPAGEKEAVAAIFELGGDVDRDEDQPGKPVYRVNLNGKVKFEIGDEHLKALAKHFPDLPKVRVLMLKVTSVTDAGLTELAGLKGLEYLYLTANKITDAG